MGWGSASLAEAFSHPSARCSSPSRSWALVLLRDSSCPHGAPAWKLGLVTCSLVFRRVCSVHPCPDGVTWVRALPRLRAASLVVSLFCLSCATPELGSAVQPHEESCVFLHVPRRVVSLSGSCSEAHGRGSIGHGPVLAFPLETLSSVECTRSGVLRAPYLRIHSSAQGGVAP